MKNSTQKGWVAVTVVFLVLLADQVSKIWIKTHMELFDTIDIAKWFQIYFVENNGMAFGIEAGENVLSLSLPHRCSDLYHPLYQETGEREL